MEVNVTLRALKDGDAEDLTEAANHPEVANALRIGFPSPYTIDHARSFISSSTAQAPQAVFAIAAEGEGSRVVGIISLVSSKPSDAEVYELGYWLHPGFWNQGIVSRGEVTGTFMRCRSF